MIVPLVAVALANGKQLSRVVVLKSLYRQMKTTIGQRLSGLADREIYTLPFSRKAKVDEEAVSDFMSLHRTCMTHKDILLSQPDHILSFKLMCRDRLVSGDLIVAKKLLEMSLWLDENVRAVLDESDEILDVKSQMIYPIGSQRFVDGQPDRWLLSQSVFDLVEQTAIRLQDRQPSTIEVIRRTRSSFPVIRFLSDDTRGAFMAEIMSEIEKGQVPSLSFEQWPETTRQRLLSFIQNIDPSDDDNTAIRNLLKGNQSYKQKILLLRGLLAHGILFFALFAKRWSVNYGLCSSRCLSAVPYRAKGVPSLSAEFGHPDVAILLTCLAYYYNGLDEAQIRRCFALLEKADDPSLEYSTWVSRCSELPIQLQNYNGVNLEDEIQWITELFPALQYNIRVADYFMANFVFPQEGKEFDEKLSASGWDIPALPNQHVTTGFSGTNDNHFILPLSITQRDIPDLIHTNAKVLNTVLRESNLRYFCAQDRSGRQLSSDQLLRFITDTDSTARILIDVGAQILDLTNQQLVKVWLEQVPDAEAAVFFDEDDVPMVLHQNKTTEPLSGSSYQGGMEHCLVYLDEVHTRGIDLPLPATARAAVTLGPKLTKDRLVQGKSCHDGQDRCILS